MFTLNRLIVVVVSLMLAAPNAGWSQDATSSSTFGATQEIPLYSGVAPGSEHWTYTERIIEGNTGPQVRDVVRPTLLYFPAQDPVGTAMIVAPGGGNRMLMMSYEGVEVARKLNEFGVDAFVLKYRLIYTGEGSDRSEPATTGPQAGQNVRELAAADGARAVELLRSRAAEFGIQPDRIGMIGYSAGGGPIRAAMAGPPMSRPDFVALIYAAGSGEGGISVPDGAPPMFLAISADDRYQSSIDTFLAWRQAEIPVELHIFQMGAHGFLNKGGGADHYLDRVKEWMQVNGWLNRKN